MKPNVAFEALKLFVGLTSADGYSTLLSHLGPDPKESSLFLVTLGPKVPGRLPSPHSLIILPPLSCSCPYLFLVSYYLTSTDWSTNKNRFILGFVKSIASWIIRNILGDPLFSEILVCSKVRSTKEFYTLVAERDRLRKRFYEDVGIFSILSIIIFLNIFLLLFFKTFAPSNATNNTDNLYYQRIGMG